MADININSESRGSVIENFLDIDPISTRFWCESYVLPYIDNVLRVQCFGLLRNYNLFQGNLHHREYVCIV